MNSIDLKKLIVLTSSKNLLNKIRKRRRRKKVVYLFKLVFRKSVFHSYILFSFLISYRFAIKI